MCHISKQTCPDQVNTAFPTIKSDRFFVHFNRYSEFSMMKSSDSGLFELNKFKEKYTHIP